MDTALDSHDATLLRPRIKIFCDKKNPACGAVYDRVSAFESSYPNLYVVVGGDGYMLRTIRSRWRDSIPFFGINTGHRGFLLNDLSVLEGNFFEDVRFFRLPMLAVVMRMSSGAIRNFHAFNDVWVERAKSQTAWVTVSVNGVVRVERLVADGALLATPAGSTAYAMSMGAQPLPLTAHALSLAFSNVTSPHALRSCVVPHTAEVTFTTCDTEKRPVFGVVDGVRVGRVTSVTVSVAHDAAVSLGFVGSRDLEEKLLEVQFPR